MHIPTRIKLNKSSKTLELGYANGEQFVLPAEFLRVLSPSAEVQGHGKPILQYGKLNVALTQVQPAGNYALKLTFDDGHDSGLYTWTYLQQLGAQYSTLWQDYLDQLSAAGRSRDPNESAVRLML
ncbi:MAG: DUF971 domain-containing protein [Pseudomonas sp.]|jgi:DUF971 family protein|nr:DUF971 domain-containing protein [Pseudomonas sp.]MDD2222187.1 DUF971 domain-containing protein [Pseudomonas sp.]MDY0413553.1 DUF971 domain-containing protein [Pseudomonas sp.]NLO54363.1 DUF971 domain-containing protein [Gammaproteobacteria bacterium]